MRWREWHGKGTSLTALAGVICLVNYKQNETRNEDGRGWQK